MMAAGAELWLSVRPDKVMVVLSTDLDQLPKRSLPRSLPRHTQRVHVTVITGKCWINASSSTSTAMHTSRHRPRRHHHHPRPIQTWTRNYTTTSPAPCQDRQTSDAQ